MLRSIIFLLHLCIDGECIAASHGPNMSCSSQLPFGIGKALCARNAGFFFFSLGGGETYGNISLEALALGFWSFSILSWPGLEDPCHFDILTDFNVTQGLIR